MKNKEQTVPKWFKGTIYKEGDTVRNPFSGESYVLNGLELSMYDFIMGSQIVFERSPGDATTKQMTEFYKGLTWFRQNNPEAYFVLLD